MATQQNLPDWVRGDTRKLRVTISDSVGATRLVSGDKLWFTMKSDPEFTDAQAEVQVSYVIQAADVTAEEAFITVNATDTDSLEVSSYAYDIQWQLDSASPQEIYTLSFGSVNITTDITRDTV